MLEEEHGVDISHATVSKSIRNMREEGVFREATIPNEEYFIFETVEFKFNPEYFAEEWRRSSIYIYRIFERSPIFRISTRVE